MTVWGCVRFRQGNKRVGTASSAILRPTGTGLTETNLNNLHSHTHSKSHRMFLCSMKDVTLTACMFLSCSQYLLLDTLSQSQSLERDDVMTPRTRVSL